MAKSFPSALLIASALCFSFFLPLAFAAPARPPLLVEGKVYCDTCRVEFETSISQPIPGSRVRLECRSRTNNSVSYQVEGVTNNEGVYRLPVDEKDHAEEICEVKLVNSGMADCSEKFKSVDKARILLTKNVGVVQQTRFANPLGFMKAKANDQCGKVLQDMGFLPLDVESQS